MSTSKIFWIHALTPLHVGSGRGLGYIDLPITREKVTHWPYIPGSAIKGVFADSHGAADDQNRNDENAAAFGKPGDVSSNAGSLVFTDARIVCLAVRSVFGTFAWCTAPMVLKRLKRDGILDYADDIVIPDEKQAIVPGFNEPNMQSKLVNSGCIYLEDLDLQAHSDAADITGIAQYIAQNVFPDNNWQNLFKERFVVVHDDLFAFLSETGTEVAAHIRIDPDTKTTSRGSLRYEESLPAESILAGTVWCDKVWREKENSEIECTPPKLLNAFCSGEKILQFGGKASTGKGRVRCIFPTRREGGEHDQNS